MIARSDDVDAVNPSAGQRVGRGARRRRRPLREIVHEASSALGDLQDEGVHLLRLRRGRVTAWLRRMAWTAATIAMLVIAGCVAMAAAVVMTMVGAAELVAWCFDTRSAVGWAVIGPLVLITLFLAAGYGKAGPDPRVQASAEANNRARLHGAFARLWRTVGTVPGLLLTGVAGAVGITLLKKRRLRRGVLLAISLFRTAAKASGSRPAARRSAPAAQAEPVGGLR